MDLSTEYLPISVETWRFIPGTSAPPPVGDDLVEVTLRFRVEKLDWTREGDLFWRGKVRTLEDWRFVAED